MADPLVTLTTDFGNGSHYVAAAKGVILALNPEVRIVDLCHDIPAQDLRQAAFFLASTLHYFPPETIHVVVVDPGVGSNRPILYVELANLRVLVPDNGCWTWLIEGGRRRPRVIRLAEQRFWRSRVSSTFHGRDIFAPWPPTSVSAWTRASWGRSSPTGCVSTGRPQGTILEVSSAK